MKAIIVVTREDGSQYAVGTPAGLPFGSLARAEQIAEVMRDAGSAIWADGEVAVLPVQSGER